MAQCVAHRTSKGDAPSITVTDGVVRTALALRPAPPCLTQRATRLVPAESRGRPVLALCNSGGMTAQPSVRPAPSPSVPREIGRPRPAGRPDLPAAETHMRRVLADELGGYDPRFHTDIDDLAGTYVDVPGRALLLVEVDGAVAGTATVRPGGPRPDLVPARLAHRYAGPAVGQVCRVWIAPRHRRRGVGRALATAAVRQAVAEGYDLVCLHTDASVPGALAFWRAFPGAVEVYDARPDPWSTVHFEIDPAALR